MSAATGRMVFHAPYPLQGEGTTGSAVRPARMRLAFAELGYDVVEVTGTGAGRGAALRALRRRLQAGERFDFCYAENSTMPTLLTETHHLPTHPLVDLQLLRGLRRRQVPAGMFYRDVYWRFPEYTERVNRLVAAGTRSLYHAELLAYRRLLDRVYVPSVQIGAYLPHLRPEQLVALPPGGDIVDMPGEPGPFTVLYVGNISAYYRMHALVRAAARVPDVRVVLCTPADAWAAVAGDYAPLPPNLQVVHRSGAGLAELFARADVCSLVVEPSEYRGFAAPVKLFEYLGHGKPVLASAGTHAAQLVDDGALGWSVPYAVADLVATLARLRDHPAEVAEARARVRVAREGHSWAARAAQVADDLGSLDRRG